MSGVGSLATVPGIVLHAAAAKLVGEFVATPSHAVLLSGPAGSGKTHVARFIAARLLDVPESALPAHGYFRTVTASKPGVESIGIEQVRELIGFFRLKVPGKAGIKRAAVIQDADQMGVDAQNALLKLLEEPPADSVLILTSSHPDRLLQTIRSRTQLLQLPAPETPALAAHFIAAGYDATAVDAALLRAGTNVAEAGRLLQDGNNAPDETVALVRQVLGGSSYERLLVVDSLSKQKETARGFVDMLATVATVSLETAARKNAATVGRWQVVLHAAHVAQDALERNTSSKLVLTELMLAL